METILKLDLNSNQKYSYKIVESFEANIEQILSNIKQSGLMFEDLTFPSSFTSKHISWMRPHILQSDNTLIGESFCSAGHLFSDITSGVVQGELSDGNLINSLLLLSNRPELIKQLYYKPKNIDIKLLNENGIYIIKLFKDNCYYYIIIDNRLPVVKRAKRSVSSKMIMPPSCPYELLYCHCNDINELWPCYIEKAYLKLLNYDFKKNTKLHITMESCLITLSWGLMCENVEIIHNEDNNKNNSSGSNNNITFKDLTERKVKYCQLIGCMIDPENDDLIRFNLNGLIPHYIYTLIDLKVINSVECILLQSNFYCKGKYNNYNNNELEKIKLTDIISAFPNYNESLHFVMSFKSFLKYFTNLYCLINPPLCYQRFFISNDWSNDFNGGNIDSKTNYLNDNKYKVKITSTSRKCDLYIQYFESDSRIKYHPNDSNLIGLHMIPVHRDINSDNSVIKLNDRKSLKNYSSSSFQYYHVSVKPDEYYLIPTTYYRNIQSSYNIAFYCDCDVVIITKEKNIISSNQQLIEDDYRKHEIIKQHLPIPTIIESLSLRNQTDRFFFLTFEDEIRQSGLNITEINDEILKDVSLDRIHYYVKDITDLYTQADERKYLNTIKQQYIDKININDVIYTKYIKEGIIDLNIYRGKELFTCEGYSNDLDNSSDEIMIDKGIPDDYFIKTNNTNFLYNNFYRKLYLRAVMKFKLAKSNYKQFYKNTVTLPVMSTFNITNIPNIISFEIFNNNRINEISKEFQSLDVYITHLEIMYIITYCSGYYTTLSQYFYDDFVDDDIDINCAYNFLMLEILNTRNHHTSSFQNITTSQQSLFCCVCRSVLQQNEIEDVLYKCTSCDNIICHTCLSELMYQYCPSCYEKSIQFPLYYKVISNNVLLHYNMTKDEVSTMNEKNEKAVDFIPNIVEKYFNDAYCILDDPNRNILHSYNNDLYHDSSDIICLYNTLTNVKITSSSLESNENSNSTFEDYINFIFFPNNEDSITINQFNRIITQRSYGFNYEEANIIISSIINQSNNNNNRINIKKLELVTFFENSRKENISKIFNEIRNSVKRNNKWNEKNIYYNTIVYDNNNEIINNYSVFSSFLKYMYSDFDDIFTEYISFIFHYNKILIGYLEQQLIPNFDEYYDIYNKKLVEIIRVINLNYPLNSWDAIVDRYNQIYNNNENNENNNNSNITLDVDQFIVVLIYDQHEYYNLIQDYYNDVDIIENIVNPFGQVVFYYRFILACYGICNNEITQDTWNYLCNLKTIEELQSKLTLKCKKFYRLYANIEIFNVRVLYTPTSKILNVEINDIENGQSYDKIYNRIEMKNILDKQLYNNSKYSFIVNSTCYHDLTLLLNDLISSLSINYWSDYSIIIRQKPNIYANIRTIFNSFKYQLLDDVSKIIFVMNNPLHSHLSYLDIFITEINKDDNVNIKNEILNLKCNLNVEIFDCINNISQKITWTRLQSLLINNSPVIFEIPEYRLKSSEYYNIGSNPILPINFQFPIKNKPLEYDNIQYSELYMRNKKQYLFLLLSNKTIICYDPSTDSLVDISLPSYDSYSMDITSPSFKNKWMNLLSSCVIRSSYISSFIIEMKYNNNNNIDKCKINIPPDYVLKHEFIPIITKVQLSGTEMEMNNGYLEISTSFIEIPFDINGISLSESEPTTPIKTVIPIRQPINKTITLSDNIITKSLRNTNTLPLFFTFPDDMTSNSSNKESNSTDNTPFAPPESSPSPSPSPQSITGNITGINQKEIQSILNKISKLNELTSTNELYNIVKELINKINSDTNTKLKLPKLIKDNSSGNNDSLLLKYMKIQQQNNELLNKLSEYKSNNMFFYLRVNNYNINNNNNNKGKRSNVVTPKLKVKSYEYSENSNYISLLDYVNDKWINYAFDKVFVDKEKENNNNSVNNNQEELSMEIISSLLLSVMKGNNVSIFSCGLEKSGKTFTLFGNNNNRGISALIVENLMSKLSSNSEISSFNLSFTVCTIINEEITDVLSTEPTKVKISSTIGNVLNGISELPIKKVEHYEKIMYKVIEKYKNPLAQLVVTINIEQKMNDKIIKNKINFIDFGNGENNNKRNNNIISNNNKSNQMKMKELQSIKQVQNAISEVIIAIDKKLKHIPYRNSKLTTILSDSFNKVVFICNLQPKNEFIDDNFLMLNYINQFVNIENDRSRNMKKFDSMNNNNNNNENNNSSKDNAKIQSLNNEIKKLSKENEDLKVIIQSYKSEINNIKSNQKLEISQLTIEHKLQNSEISKQLQSSLVKIRELEYEIQQKDEEISSNENKSELSKLLENNKVKIIRLTKEKNALHQSLQDKEMEIAQLKRICKNKDLMTLQNSMKDYRKTLTIGSILEDDFLNNNNNINISKSLNLNNSERKYYNSSNYNNNHLKPNYSSTLPPQNGIIMGKSNNNNNNNSNTDNDNLVKMKKKYNSEKSSERNSIILHKNSTVNSKQQQQQQRIKRPMIIKPNTIAANAVTKKPIVKPMTKPVRIISKNIKKSNIPKSSLPPVMMMKRTNTNANTSSNNNNSKNPVLMSAAERRRRFGNNNNINNNNNNHIQKRIIITKPINNRNNNNNVIKTVIKHNISDESYKLNEIESSNIISPPLSKYERCSNGIYDDYEDEY